MLKLGGFLMIDGDLWPSVFWHPELKLLMVVYVDDFKMSGPKENLPKGWKLIGERVDMDTPCACNRYLGCDHVFKENVKLRIAAHPFAHLFDKSLPDPAAKPASSAVRRQDFWESDCHPVLVRSHVQPRRKLYTPDATVFAELGISPIRFTEIEQCQPGGAAACATRTIWDRTDDMSNHDKLPMWTGTTYFVHYSCDPRKAMAALKRDKLVAKQKVRAQGFKFLDEVETDKKCMNKTVNVGPQLHQSEMFPFLGLNHSVTLLNQLPHPSDLIQTFPLPALKATKKTASQALQENSPFLLSFTLSALSCQVRASFHRRVKLPHILVSIVHQMPLAQTASQV